MNMIIIVLSLNPLQIIKIFRKMSRLQAFLPLQGQKSIRILVINFPPQHISTVIYKKKHISTRNIENYVIFLLEYDNL